MKTAYDIAWDYVCAGNGAHSAAVVIPFEDAPPQLKELSTHGGDEDWILLVREDAYAVHYSGAFWVDKLGVCDTEQHVLEDPDSDFPPRILVLIGAHA